MYIYCMNQSASDSDATSVLLKLPPFNSVAGVSSLYFSVMNNRLVGGGGGAHQLREF